MKKRSKTLKILLIVLLTIGLLSSCGVFLYKRITYVPPISVEELCASADYCLYTVCTEKECIVRESMQITDIPDTNTRKENDKYYIEVYAHFGTLRDVGLPTDPSIITIVQDKPYLEPEKEYVIFINKVVNEENTYEIAEGINGIMEIVDDGDNSSKICPLNKEMEPYIYEEMGTDFSSFMKWMAASEFNKYGPDDYYIAYCGHI